MALKKNPDGTVIDPAKILESIAEDGKKLDTLGTRLDTIEKKLSEPNRVFHATSGPIGQDSQPYSILKAAAFCTGHLSREQAKYEIDVHNRLRDYYKKMGWVGNYGNSTFLMPFSPDHISAHPDDDEGVRLREEVRYKMSGWGQPDPDEYRWLARRMGGWRQKALGTSTDTAGGSIVGFPALGELVDLQRNMEVFPNAGATEIGLPPNGRLQFPKLTGGATAYWVGEAQSIAESQETTGFLDLLAKKLGIMVKMNNELIRFASPTAEAMVRQDMARVAALKADLAMLEGTGGTQIKGLITYDTQSSWTVGTDKLILLTATTTGSTGDTLTGPDIAKMVEALPDAVPEPTAFVMRKALWAAIKNFRSDAITTGDAAGQFLFSQFRGLDTKEPETLAGYKVVRSSQVSKTRVKSSGTTNTYILTGYFPDWIIARFGVMEFLATTLGDTAFQQDQTWLRGIELLDAGPRHAASFCIIDNLANTSGA